MATLTGDEFNNDLAGTSGDDTISGLGGNDTLTGSAGIDTLDGGEGDDFLYGGAQADIMFGGLGDDKFYYASQANLVEGERVDGGEGFDRLLLANGVTSFDMTIGEFISIEAITADSNSFQLFLRPEQLSSLQEIRGNGTFDIFLVGSGTVDFSNMSIPIGTPRIHLSDLGNEFDARTFVAGAVIVLGGNGDDIISLGRSTDEAHGGAGNDYMRGGSKADFLYGDEGDDYLEGNGKADYLDGGDGSDILKGGSGPDTLIGGSNIDTAVFAGARSGYLVRELDTGAFQITGPQGDDLLMGVEYAQFDDMTIRLLPGPGIAVNFESSDPSTYQDALNNIRDFDGNTLGGAGHWLRIGGADINGDGDLDQILVNDTIGRFAIVGGTADGLSYFNDFSWAGETRVVGIYIDPLVQSGDVVAGSDNDSQRRFQNDLSIANINRVLGADDYDGNGLREVYLALTDGTAYLHAYLHADGNIQYANYQSQQQVIDYLSQNGFGSETYGDWFT